MAVLKDIMAYICHYYPYKEELSKARLTKLVYLVDWISAVVRGKQMSNITWVFNHYGPYVDDVINTARENSLDFEVNTSQTIYWSTKETIAFKGDLNKISLTDDEKSVIEAVVEKTKPMNFSEFIKYVYSTYPVVSETRYSVLDLEKLAKEYNEIRKVAS